MASQGTTASFVHLVALADDDSHGPQVFRMRGDQPLRRLARAYVVYREFGKGAEADLTMTHARHGELDPDSNLCVYGLAEGDQVTFSYSGAGKAKKARLEVPAAHAGGPQNNEVDDAGEDSEGLVKQEPTATQGPHERKNGASGEAGATNGIRRKAGAKAKSAPKAKSKAKAKAKAASREGGKPVAKAKAKSKAKAKAVAKVVRPEAEAQQLVAPGADPMPLDGLGDPALLRGMARTMTVSMGPAKGWKVTVWLQDIRGRQSRTHDSAIRWRMVSPDRSKVFTKFASVQKNVGEGVYIQLYTAVRPVLSRKILARRKILEGGTARNKTASTKPTPIASPENPQTPATRRQRPSPKQTPVPMGEPPRPRRGLAAGAPGVHAFAATQAYAITASQVGSKKEDWTCGCTAHLCRHPKCLLMGTDQPSVVHLRDYMSVGRGETCDIVLDSKRTPQMISRCHAVLNGEDGKYTLTDQASLNGVLVNNERIEGQQVLENGDLVTFGVPTPQPEFDYIFKVRPLA
mmetsp:Transcript_29880/g.68875  ORF Transcript_29880/g.68875 Transcript_29880/m.68875 type:complete len:518 (-) Transcript_29880:142-1695(-)